SKVGVIISKENIDYIEKEKKSFSIANIQFTTQTVKNNKEIKSAFLSLKSKGIDILWLYPDKWLTEKSFKMILQESMKSKISVISPSGHFVEKGALMSVYSDPAGVGNQAAVIIKDIFYGKKISEIGVQYPVSTRVDCNLTTAKQLGLESSDFVRTCDTIYE
ncbi:MAG: ABC transporter substrate binding protein, partial [Candidatus Zixiibacteriota bacterium]